MAACFFQDPGKPHFSGLAFFHVPKALKLDFIQLPLGMGYQYALVVGCICSGRGDAFPCHEAKVIAFTVTNCAKMFPTWGIPQGYLHNIAAPPHAMGWWLGTCHCFPSQPLIVGSLHGWHVNLWRFASAAEHLAALLNHLQQWGWAVNPQKIQGPGTALTFLGVIWSGKTHIVPESVTDILQAYHYHEVWKRYRLLWEFWDTGE